MPYAFLYTTAILAMTAVLVRLGQLDFVGNVWAYAPSLFMTGMAFALIGLLIAWNTKNPGEGAGLMTYIVPPGFILGGATMATGYARPWAMWLSNLFPLVWQYRFYRGFTNRGTPLESMFPTYGVYGLYLTILTMLVWWRWRREKLRFEDSEVERLDDTLSLLNDTPSAPGAR